mmetsp:Transcript_20910/g.58479  ORF Transcript_20910/g.58479 Transcript_20910/m.58479 type:complete len:231 (-) Transcript_20910:457-1149(-)
MASIPTIDFSPFMLDEGCMVGGSPTASQRQVADQINSGMCEHGFLYVDNLGIEEEEVVAAFDAGRALFEGPSCDGSKLAQRTPQTNMGYVPLMGEHANPTRSPDLHEAFVIKSRRCFENDFRGTPAGFEETTSIFWDKAEKAARRFQIACALALDLPASDLDFFARTTPRFNMASLKYNYYPPCDFEAGSTDGESGSASIRIGEHSDFGLLTFLFLNGPTHRAVGALLLS